MTLLWTVGSGTAFEKGTILTTQPSSSETSSFVESSRVGVTILSAFALVWAIAAVTLSSLPLPVTLVCTGLVLAAALTLIIVASSRTFTPTDEARSPIAERHRRTVFIASNIAQAMLFSALISVCIALNHLAYIPLVGSLIVGAHLIPIGLSFAEFNFVAGGGLLIVTGTAGTLTAWTSLAAPASTAGVVSLANAAVLLGLAGLQVYLHSSPKK